MTWRIGSPEQVRKTLAYRGRVLGWRAVLVDTDERPWRWERCEHAHLKRTRADECARSLLRSLGQTPEPRTRPQVAPLPARPAGSLRGFCE